LFETTARFGKSMWQDRYLELGLLVPAVTLTCLERLLNPALTPA
jgi:hypothetical protein